VYNRRGGWRFFGKAYISLSNVVRMEISLVTETVDKSLQKIGVTLSKPALAVVFIVFSILLFVYPQLVAYIIGIFLLIQGILLLVEYYQTTHKTYILQSMPQPAKNVPPPPPTPVAPSPSQATQEKPATKPE
jgi:hypothetical protein